MNLFPKITRPYYIVSPSYEYRSSGVRSLHLLCHALNEAGYTAQLAAYGSPFFINHDLNTPVATIGELINPIVVYPDIIKGNPMNAKTVVRYLMAERGKYGGDTEFVETDQVWGALPSLADNVLRIPVSDPNIFWHKENLTYRRFDNGQTIPKKEIEYGILPRSGSCFYSCKYDLICKNELLPITDGMTRLQGSLGEIADILRKSERCYIYELTSAMTEAALCGCPVTLIRTPFFNTIDPTCMMGDVRWDDGEIVKKCSDFLPEYKLHIRNFEGQLKEFIRKTQEMT